MDLSFYLYEKGHLKGKSMTSSNPLVSSDGTNDKLLFKSTRYSVISQGNDQSLRILKTPQPFARPAVDVGAVSGPLRPAASIVLENEVAQEVALDIQAAVTHEAHPSLIDTMLDNFLQRPVSLLY
jgi:hypothetical protein